MRFAPLVCLALAGCATVNQPAHPLVGVWNGQKVLILGVSEYSYADERGQWTADSRSLRFRVTGSSRGVEQCSFAVRGRSLELSGCRLAGSIVGPSRRFHGARIVLLADQLERRLQRSDPHNAHNLSTTGLRSAGLNALIKDLSCCVCRVAFRLPQSVELRNVRAPVSSTLVHLPSRR